MNDDEPSAEDYQRVVDTYSDALDATHEVYGALQQLSQQPDNPSLADAYMDDLTQIIADLTTGRDCFRVLALEEGILDKEGESAGESR